jgi:hypothetical protein
MAKQLITYFQISLLNLTIAKLRLMIMWGHKNTTTKKSRNLIGKNYKKLNNVLKINSHWK